MEIIDDLQDNNPFKYNRNLLLRYLGTGIFFWIALVNLVRVVDDLFKIFVFQKLKSVSTVFWLSEISNILFFFLFTFLFLRILNKSNLSNKRTFFIMIASLSLIYILSILSLPFINASFLTFGKNGAIDSLYSYDWYIVFLYLNLPIKLLIIGLLFFKKIRVNE